MAGSGCVGTALGLEGRLQRLRLQAHRPQQVREDVIRLELEVVGLEDCQNLSIRCLNTGTYVRFVLTEAQEGTFLDTEMGMDPQGIATRVWDAIAGQRYFRAWLAQTLQALDNAARARRAQPASPKAS